MRRILAATDFSAGAPHAIERARRLAASCGAELVIAHCGSVTEEELRAKLPPTLRATLAVGAGAVPTALAAVAREHAVDLVVIGRPARATFSGSTAERVLLACECPVIVVKHRPQRDYARVVIAADMSEPSRLALTTTLRLFPDCAVTLVHAYEAPFQAFLDAAETGPAVEKQRRAEADAFVRKALAEVPGSAAREVGIVLREGLAFREVAREAVRQDADLVAFGTHGRTGLGRLVLGSVAGELLDGIGCDALVVRPCS